MAYGPVQVGKGGTFKAKPMRGRPGRPIQLPNSTIGVAPQLKFRHKIRRASGGCD